MEGREAARGADPTLLKQGVNETGVFTFEASVAVMKQGVNEMEACTLRQGL
jgi:hypothetical protein